MATQTIIAIPGPEWKLCAAALGKIEGSLPRDLPRVIKRRGPALLSEIKGRVQSLPTPQGAGHTGLRAAVAAGTSLGAAPGGIAFESSLAGSRAPIPAGLDSLPAGGWFHPTWGHGPIQFQKGYSWFTKPLEAHKGELGNKLEHVLEDAADFVASFG